MSTSDNMSGLPDIAIIRHSWKAAAMFDAIADPDNDWRVFGYIDCWRNGASYGYIDTRQGEAVRAALLDDAGVIWGYDEEAPLALSPNKLVDWALSSNGPIPADLREHLSTREFDCGGATFCFWRGAKDQYWQVSPLLSGPSSVQSHVPVFLDMLQGDSRSFQTWVHEFHERTDLDELIDAMYRHEPLTLKMIKMVDEGRNTGEVRQLASEIGYPLARW